jgi:hypothetical protein
MKSSTIPLTCGIVLCAMSAAVGSHWWSVRQFVAAVDTGLPVSTPVVPPEKPAPSPAKPEKPAPPAGKPATLASKPADFAPGNHQKDFYESLIRRIENLQDQNRDLLDQVAETNRDLMKLEFRVDTHSEQFRPLPVSEDRIDTTFDMETGVLPPRAEPVTLPSYE